MAQTPDSENEFEKKGVTFKIITPDMLPQVQYITVQYITPDMLPQVEEFMWKNFIPDEPVSRY